jgi:hypothetical protein
MQDNTQFVVELLQKINPIIKGLDTPYPQDSEVIQVFSDHRNNGEEIWYIRAKEVSSIVSTIIDYTTKYGCPELEEATQNLLRVLRECGRKTRR